MSARIISSIKEYIVHYSIVIFVVVFLAAAIHYFVYSRYLHNLHQQQQAQSLDFSAASVARLLGFYQSVVDKISQQHVVIDLLQFGSHAEVQQWATDTQRLLPESIGLALFDNNGKVKGDRSELRLSDRCFTDMHRRFQGLDIPRPPVHYMIEHLAHFDIVSPVVVDSENIGLVFASFSLDTIGNLLNAMSYEGATHQIVTPENYQIAVSGEIVEQGAENFKSVIPDTDWVIKKYIRDSGSNAFVASLLISNILTFILVSIVLFIAIKRLFGLVVSDFETLSWMMHKIKQGDFDPKKVPVPHLAETAGVVRFIQHAAEELNVYQQELKRDSTTDELTGLSNRRVLNEKLEFFMLQADTGHNVFVVILDLDYFKDINDQHGHDVGDRVLKSFADALNKNCKPTDVVTRAGGDEFIVILDGYEVEGVKYWYASLCDELQQSMVKLYSKNELKYGVSAGCTCIRNNDNKSALLKRADDALYKVKTQGRNNILCD